MSKCPEGAITSFPLQMGITATDILYDSVNEPITMDFQWASRSTPPSFVDTVTSITDEVGSGNTNVTTLRFLNNSYSVSSVQFVAASHTPWILPTTAQAKNKEDIIITFSSSNTNTVYNYLTFVIPILRSGSALEPNYLKGLSNPNANGPFSVNDLFPKNPNARFAYYSTCLQGFSQTAPTANVYVFVCTNGIQVSSRLMDGILAASGKSTTFGSFTPPYVSRLTDIVTVLSSNTDFTNFVMTTTDLLNYAGFSAARPSMDTNIRKDDTSAYQCVPIDPDSVVDGQINVDLTTGGLSLKDVMEQRDALRAAHGLKPSMDPGRLEAFLGTALGIMLAVVFAMAILYFLFAYVSGAQPSDTNDWIYSIPKYVLIVLFASLFGFVLGSMVS